MRPISYAFAATLAALALVTAPPASAQASYGGIYCPVGLEPDGYIDFSDLPAPPTVPQGTPSPAVTATLPVHGVPGLTVAVTIAAGPSWQASHDTLTFTGPATVNLVFNKPIYGAGYTGIAGSRFDHAYSIVVGQPSGATTPFTSSVANYNNVLYSYWAAPVEFVTRYDPPQYVTLSGDPGEDQGAVFKNLRVQSASAPDPSDAVTRDGLEMWLRADKAGSSGWEDQSGQGHNAAVGTGTPGNNSPQQPGYPGLSFTGAACTPTFTFSNGAYFTFNLPMNGWRQMTVFLVAKSDDNPTGGTYGSESAPLFWNESQPWGNTYVSPFQTHVDFRFGTTQVGNDPNIVRPRTVGGDYSITRAVHNDGTDTLYIDGIEYFTQSGKLPVLAGMDGTGYIGRGYNNTYFNGDISEILVYNRTLTGNEVAKIESYLRYKYNLH